MRSDTDRVIAIGDPGQHSHRLALRASADEHGLVVGKACKLVNCHHQAAWNLQQAKVTSHTHVAHHRTTHERDATPVQGSHVDDLLDPVHMAGEGRHDDAPVGPQEDAVEHRLNVALAGNEAWDLGIGAVDHQQIHALVTDASKAVQIGDPSVERKLIHLEVAGVQDRGTWSANGQCKCIGDRVIHRQKLHAELADLHGLAFGDQIDGGRYAMLPQLAFKQRQGEAGSVDGNVLAKSKEVRKGADVILMPVREHDCLDVVEPIGDGTEIRKDEVDSGLGILGKEHSAVQDQQAAVKLEDGHVATDLAEPAQGQNSDRTWRKCWRRRQFAVHHRATCVMQRTPRRPRR